MPKGTIDIEEIIEKIDEFTETKNKDILAKLNLILNSVKEQKDEIIELKKKVTDLEADLKAGKLGAPIGVGTSVPISNIPPTQTPIQTPIIGSGPSGPTAEQQKEAEWNTFFSDKNDVTDKDAWKNSLSIDDAKKVYGNGWRSLTNEYSSDGQTTKSIDQKVHQKGEIDKAHKLLNRIKNETNLSNLPSDGDIGAYDQSKVPGSVNHDAVKKERDNKLKSLFKAAFEGGNKTHGLSDDDIDKWRTTETGLSRNGVDERKVVDNGWADKRGEIKDKQVPVYSYNGKETKNIDVLKVNKVELDKVHDILAEISSKKTFFELPVNYEGDKYKITDLKYNQLSDDTKQVIAKAIENQRNTFTYKVNVENNEKKGDGLTSQRLADALKEINDNKKEPQKYKPLTSKILNDFLNASDLKISQVDDKNNPKLDSKKNPITEQVKIMGDTVEDLDAPNEKLYKDKDGKPCSWLQFQGAFKLPKALTDEEDHLDLKIKGTKLLPYFYKENNYNPDNPSFCHFTEEGGKKEIPIQPKTLPDGKPNPETGAPIDKSGLLAIATGVGKTTKTINCLINGGERNIILICPTAALCSSAAKHHEGWLQTWGCVVHQKPLMKGGQPVTEEVEDPITKEFKQAPRYESHGTYPVRLNDLVYYENENGEVQGNKGLSVLEMWALLAFLTRRLWSKKPSKKENSGMELVLERIKIMKEPDKSNYEKWVKMAVSKFIPKGTIIAFDEAHFGKADYQILVKQVIFLTKSMGFEVIKMSATFRGIPFSSTSTFPRRNLYMSSIQSKFKLGDEEVDFDALLAKSKVWIFIPNAERELNEKQKGFMKGVSNVVFNQPFDDFCESISFGMPSSTAMEVDGSKEMGFTPDIDIVILTNITETANLQTNWQYSTPNFSWISLASFAQQIGRAARIKDGWAITTSKDLEEFVIKPEVSVYVIQAALSADPGALAKMKTAGFSDVNHLRGSIALANEENKKWGLYPAELVVGASAGTDAYPKWERAKDSFRVDDALWKKHMGTYEAPKIEPQVAKDIMDVMAATYVKKPILADEKTSANRFPFEINVEMKSSLIKAYGLDPQDVKKVLNGVIEERRKEIDEERIKRGNPTPDPVEFKTNEEDLFHETVSLLRLALEVEPGKNLTVKEETDKEGKKFWVMRIKYNPTPTQRKIETRKLDIDMKNTEKLQAIRTILIKKNLQAYEGDLGKEVREALEENTIEGYKNIIIKLRSARLGNVLRDHIGWSNAMSLVNDLETSMEKTSEELQANIEVNPNK